MNCVQLMGRLTKDPEINYGKNDISIVRFTLAVNKRVKKGEEKTADFIFCKAFGKTAEFINNYFKKGQQVVVVGRISTGSYEKDGQKIYTTDVIVEETFFADSKREGNSEQSTALYTETRLLTEEEMAEAESKLPF